jgi:hypothetical protein
MKVMHIIGEILLYIILLITLLPWIIAFGIGWIFGQREDEDAQNRKIKNR